MKKFLAILLALVLCLSLGVTAFAADDVNPPAEGGETPAAAAGATHDPVTLTKAYTLNGAETQVYPEETLTFTVEADEANPDASMITIADVDTAESLNIVLEFPTYTKMGVYTYTITEDEGETLGVTYDSAAVTVVVTVINEKAGDGTTDVLKAYVQIFNEEGEKTADEGEDPTEASFTNDYGVGQLTVTKTVTGNLASNTKLFTIHVSFSGGTNAGAPISYTLPDGTEAELPFEADGTATLDIELKHQDSAVFTNIPAGVSYTVEEDEQHTTGDLNSEEGYTASYENEEGEIAAEDDITCTVTNEKKTEIQTGISLDSLPYILIAVAVVAALVIMVIRKRRYSED